MKLLCAATTCSLALLLQTSAFGAFGVTTVGGQQIAKPTSALPGSASLQGPTIKIWYEGISEATGQTVNHDGREATNMSGLTPNPNGVLVAGNTPGQVSGPLRSYMIHFDHNGSATATFTFENAIKGLAYERTTLQATDVIFGTGTDWWDQSGEGGDNQPNNRGLEANDSISVSADGKTLTINVLNANGNALDNIRVLTAVPEFTTILSWAMLAGIGCVVYRRYQK